jgi:hypothetical protein
MLLNSQELKHMALYGLPKYNIAPFPIVDTKNQVDFQPYKYIYASYTRSSEAQKLFRNSETGALFEDTDRIWLIEKIIQCNLYGAGYDLDELMLQEAIIDCYPCHQTSNRLALENQWFRWKNASLDQPFQAIRNYFGVKVALYFLFLGHSTHWLFYPAFAGLLTGLLLYFMENSSYHEWFVVITPAFGAFMVIWSTLYLENWKRVNADASLKWGTSEIQVNEVLRPQFQGEPIDSPIDGRLTLYFNPREKMRRMVLSWVVISLLIAMVLAFLAMIFYLQYEVTIHASSSNTREQQQETYYFLIFPIDSTFVAVANAVQILIMSLIYNKVSILLNEFENHRTEVEYENSLIIKTVIFQFVNNYAGLFYVAFMKKGLEESCDGSCMDELQSLLSIVYISRLFLENFTEFFIPRLMVLVSKYQLQNDKRLRTTTTAAAADVTVSQVEQELFMAPYDWQGTFDDYTEMVLQFGYTTMFVAAFPFAPLLSYVNNYFEIRMDSFRLLHEARRPRPKRAKNIGSWYRVLQAFGAISICTNAGVILFTGDFFNTLSTASRVWVFTLFVILMFFLKYVLEVSIEDVPTSVQAQLKRQHFLVGKCLYHVPDALQNRNTSRNRSSRLDSIQITSVSSESRRPHQAACLDMDD